MAKGKHEVALHQPPSSDSASLMVIIDRAAKDPTFDVAKLDQLLQVKERWDAAEAKRAFVAALNAFKKDPPTLTKNKQVKYGQGERVTDYRHATLDQVSAVIGKALSLVGITHRWDVVQADSTIRVGCILTHERGHSERVEIVGVADASGSKNAIQAVGSTITYLQRYTLLAATGMAVKGQDDDGIKSGSLTDKESADFETAIDSAVDEQGLEGVWKSIVKACQSSGDRASYDSLKAKVTAKGKKLKGKK